MTSKLPYQVFLAYKQTDTYGKEAQDRRIAERLYDELSKRGVNVYFSDAEKHSYPGTTFYDAIDSALNESLVLVVIGTSVDNIESRWPKYEWSSFHCDLLNGVKPVGQIVSLTKGINSSALPRPLRLRESFPLERKTIEDAATYIVRELGVMYRRIEGMAISQSGDNVSPGMSSLSLGFGYDVILRDFRDNKLASIKEIRMFGVKRSREEAAMLIRRCPNCLAFSGLSLESAAKYSARLKATGAVARVERFNDESFDVVLTSSESANAEKLIEALCNTPLRELREARALVERVPNAVVASGYSKRVAEGLAERLVGVGAKAISVEFNGRS